LIFQLLDEFEPFAVFHRDQCREITAVPLQDDALAPDDPKDDLGEGLARLRGG